MADAYEAHRKRPLAEHLADYKGALAAKGDTDQHVELTASRIQAMLDGTEAVYAADLDLAKVNGWLVGIRRGGDAPTCPAGQAEFTPGEVASLLGVTTQTLREAVRRHCLAAGVGRGKARRLPRATVEALCRLAGRGVGAESVNHYVRAIRGFMRWLVFKAKRLPANPLDGLELTDADADRRHARRELAAGELSRLLAATRASGRVFRGLSGEDRFHLYAAACGTGFRAGALAGLRPEDFDLDASGGGP